MPRTWQDHQSRFHDSEHEYRSPHLRPGQPRNLILEKLTAVVRSVEDPLVLDVGAGHGSFTSALLGAGAAHVICTEMSEDAADRLRQRFAHDPRVAVVHDADSEAVFAQDPVDLVCLMSLLHHIPDYITFLERLPQIISEGGSLMAFQDPTYYPRRSRLTSVIDRGTYFAWRIGQGDIAEGIKSLVRRLLHNMDEDNARDMVEYHVVRQGVDERAVVDTLRPRFKSVELIPYWSAHGRTWQRIIGKTNMVNTFGVIASSRLPDEQHVPAPAPERHSTTADSLERSQSSPNPGTPSFRLGFACAWWHPRPTTWSNIPAGLLGALSQQPSLTVVPVDGHRSVPLKAALAVAHKVPLAGPWQVGHVNRWLTDYKVRRGVERGQCDAVLALASAKPVLRQPTFFFQDASFGAMLSYLDSLDSSPPFTPTISHRRLVALAAQERMRYQRATGVFTMGQWFASWLADEGLVQQDRVHPVGGGLNSLPVPRDQDQRDSARNRLLFVGRDFFRKGGDLVVKAVAELRASGDRPFVLTVAGPERWPLPGAPPHWVDFRGDVPPTMVAQLMAVHDIFVLPSWFEPYGLVFLEARAAAMPSVARRAFAMPELVPEGHAGTLVDEGAGASQVAEAINAVSNDEGLFAIARQEAAQVAHDNTWQAVASRIVAEIRRATN